MRFLREHELASPMGIAHVRHATQGADTLVNTQPFNARLDGRLHVFAHNGVIRDSASLGPFAPPWQPLGEADSECAFALLMQRLAALPDKRRADWHARFEVFSELCVELRPRGIFNLLFSDSEYLYAHAHKRTSVIGIMVTIRPPPAYGIWHTARIGRTRVRSLDCRCIQVRRCAYIFWQVCLCRMRLGSRCQKAHYACFTAESC